MQHVNATLPYTLWSPSGGRDQLSDSWRVWLRSICGLGVSTPLMACRDRQCWPQVPRRDGSLLGHAPEMFDAVNPSIDRLLDRCQAVRMRRDRQSGLMGQLNQQAHLLGTE